MNRPRRGYLLVEAFTAMVLLAILLGVCLKMNTMTAVARRSIERRAVALEEAANLLERVTRMPVDQVTSEGLAQLEISSDVKQVLPEAAATIVVEPTEGPPAGKRVRVEIVWLAADGQREAPVRLSRWYFSAPADGATK